jgi:transglutaminase-like putative cysteine protease
MIASSSVINLHGETGRHRRGTKNVVAYVAMFAHLAVTLSRCMNIPARYCTGYLGDIGVPVDPNPMDFSGWYEVFLDGRWITMDARHNHPRIGRIVIVRGRDAAVSPSQRLLALLDWYGSKSSLRNLSRLGTMV